ncbi:MAG TPA: NAD(P)-binding domain-containing protein, partial [Terriglobia bacterium]|nr:NAD(P)-binding domain-containing protein [Terriglobia bacterium]
MAESVGFIGLGIMGEPMALNLVKAGYHVSVYNRTHEKTQSLEQAGARVASTPAEAAQNADYVMSIVSDSAASEEVMLGKEGVLQRIKPGAIVIDSATISPVVSRRLACATAGKKANFL